MSDAVKAALITGILGVIAAVSTWALTEWSNYREKEKLRAQAAQTTSPEGIYLWPVTGDSNGVGWSGYINVDSQGTPNIQMWRLDKCPNNQIVRLPLLQQVQSQHAEVTIREKGRLHIHIPVQFIKYDNPCQTPPKGQQQKLEPLETLEGDIDQTIGYVGYIRYIKPDGQQPFGGMILAKSTSSFPIQ